jgi:hypothetical protein
LPRLRIAVQVTILLIFEICLFAGITPFLWFYGSSWSFAAAGTAAGLCTISALLSFCVHFIYKDTKISLTPLLLGMAFNMGIPLIFGTIIHLRGGPLSTSGFIYYLVLFYIMTLALKTFLTLPQTEQTKTKN